MSGLMIAQPHGPCKAPDRRAADILDRQTVFEALARRGVARQFARHGGSDPEKAGAEKRDAEKRREEGEGLVAHGARGIDAERRRGAGGGEGEPAGVGQPLAQEILQRAKSAQRGVGEPLHAGTLVSRSRALISAGPFAPANLACGSSTTRCASTLAASSWTSSGVTNSCPSRSASALVACTSAMEARGPQPSSTCGAARVRRTRSTM